MKKLMIAFAVVAAAALSQAGTVNWGLTGVTTSDGETANGYNAYMFGYETGKADDKTPTAANIVSMIQSIYTDGYDVGGGTIKKGTEGVQAFLDTGYAITPGSAGNYSRGTGDKIDAETVGLYSGKNNDVFVLFLDTATVTEDTMVAVSKGLTNQAIPGSGNKTLTFGSQTTFTAEAKWASINAPEPTSGLLLLLGVGALALRRRRA